MNDTIREIELLSVAEDRGVETRIKIYLAELQSACARMAVNNEGGRVVIHL